MEEFYKKIQAKYVNKDDDCEWCVYTSWESRTGEFKIKTYELTHTCVVADKNPRINYKYLVKQFLPLYRDSPSFKLSEFHKIIKKNLKDYHISNEILEDPSSYKENHFWQL
ncbi:hypothetical protein ACFE04_000309 [Oxalis oulophora]